MFMFFFCSVWYYLCYFLVPRIIFVGLALDTTDSPSVVFRVVISCEQDQCSGGITMQVIGFYVMFDRLTCSTG